MIEYFFIKIEDLFDIYKRHNRISSNLLFSAPLYYETTAMLMKNQEEIQMILTPTKLENIYNHAKHNKLKLIIMYSDLQKDSSYLYSIDYFEFAEDIFYQKFKNVYPELFL